MLISYLPNSMAGGHGPPVELLGAFRSTHIFCKYNRDKFTDVKLVCVFLWGFFFVCFFVF